MKETEKIGREVFTRRDFLDLGIAVSASVIIRSGLAVVEHLESLPDEEAEMLSNSENPIEAYYHISQIKKYRKSLGLNGLPDDLSERLSKNVSWETEPPPFENDLPILLRSYGNVIEEINEETLGSNHTRLVRGVTINENSPHGLAFNTYSRKCELDIGLHNISIQESFIDIALHESIGHGTDPALSHDYPSDVLLEVEHGKWRALSQAFSIEGQFLKHPGDLMYPRLKRMMGANLGLLYVTNKLGNDLKQTDTVNIVSMIENLSIEAGQNPQDIRFNKKLCSSCGERLLEFSEKELVELKGYLKNVYTKNLESILVEIYAEMMKYALVHPKDINRNKHVLRGVETVISAIRGQDVNIQQIGEDILSLNPEDLQRNKEESAALNEVFSPESAGLIEELSSEGMTDAINEVQEIKSIEDELFAFAHQGQIPKRLSISNEDYEVLYKYASALSQVTQKHPTVLDRNDSFDPLLHIWEIWSIENAADSTYIRTLFNEPENIATKVEEIEKHIEVLRNFINSSAF